MEILNIIIQGGAVGLAAFILWIGYKLASNHLHDISSNLKELNEAVRELVSLIKGHIGK